MTVTLTTTENQKNNSNNNITIIDLGECEDLLRKEYSIPDNEILYMKKIDVIQEGMKIPKIEYDVYYKSGNILQKLNLSICEKTKISLSIPIEISENLDKLNTSSGYFNDLCYIASSDSGTDISLIDRKKEFVEGNKTVCQDDCDFSEYDYETQKAKCSCQVKESSNSFNDIKIDTTKLYNKFVDIKNIANIKLLACYKVLFSKKGFISNIASYCLIPIAIFHIIVIILFYKNQRNEIDNKIKDISYSIRNWDLVKADEIERKNKERMKRLEKRKKKIKICKNNINKKEEEKKVIKILNPIDYYFLENVLKKDINPNPPNKKRKIIRSKVNINNNFVNNINNNIIKTQSNENSKKIIRKNNKQQIIKKSKAIMDYDDEEKNSLSYKLALKFDKRSYCEYYISLLKTKHIFMFAFFQSKDYNVRILKIDLFFLNFSIYFTVNALFFNDNTMHKIYEDQGSFNFIYQLPQIIYSSLH